MLTKVSLASTGNPKVSVRENLKGLCPQIVLNPATIVEVR